MGIGILLFPGKSGLIALLFGIYDRFMIFLTNGKYRIIIRFYKPVCESRGLQLNDNAKYFEKV